MITFLRYFWRQWRNPPHYPFWERLRGAYLMGKYAHQIHTQSWTRR
jgi:hypothetical protein